MSHAIAPDLRFVTVCELHELPVGLGRAFRVGSHSIALFRLRTGKVFAVANVCPHRGGPLHQRTAAEGTVTCPLHGWSFHIEEGSAAGRGMGGAGSIPVREDGGSIELML